MTGLFRRWRRRLLLARGLIPEAVWRRLLANHPILSGLSHEELTRLRELATLFLHEKRFEFSGGLEPDDAKTRVVAVQACLPILNLGIEWYGNWNTVVLVPDLFVQEHQALDRAGVMHEWEEEKGGEAWERGPVVLSWEDVEASGWGDGYNVVIHEAAHQLDLLDGELNGRPELPSGLDPAEWREVFSRAFKDFKRGIKSGKKPRIDDYAAENDAEFFAVMSEEFFERPSILKVDYPEVYGLLRRFYRQDPGQRRR